MYAHMHISLFKRLSLAKGPLLDHMGWIARPTGLSLHRLSINSLTTLLVFRSTQVMSPLIFSTRTS
jgi:hypothetical protein